MSPRAQQLLDEALQLSEEDRRKIVDLLIDSIEDFEAPIFDEALLAEIDRRSREVKEGLVETIPWEEVQRNARARLHRAHENRPCPASSDATQEPPGSTSS